MGLQRVSHVWREQVDGLLPGVPAPQRHALADFSVAVPLAQQVIEAKVAAALPAPASVPSTERRLRRFLANEHVDAVALRQTVAARLLEQAARTQATVWLALDETAQGKRSATSRGSGDALRVLSVRLLSRRRAVPLSWAVHRPGEQTLPYPALIASLLAEVAALIPAGTAVVLLCDRGLCWPTTIRCCLRLGWSYLMRAQGQTRVQLDDGSERTLAALAPRPGSQWLGSARVFKDAGWLTSNIVALWRPGDDEPWLLLTDRPATLARCTEYKKRMWVEESFRDDKGLGFHWQQSRVRDPAHANRLLLVLQLAMALTLSMGRQVVKRGLRGLLTRSDRWEVSVFGLGLAWLRRCLIYQMPFRPRLLLFD